MKVEIAEVMVLAVFYFIFSQGMHVTDPHSYLSCLIPWFEYFLM
jgi:hypothetical protein